jgi:hypothetical protein
MSLAGPRLLIALDHTEAVDPEDFRYDVFPKLIEPIVLDPNANVGLLLAGLGVTGLLRGIKPGHAVVLTPFEACEMPMLARQYLRFHPTWSPAREHRLASVIEGPHRSLMPEIFEELRNLMEKF